MITPQESYLIEVAEHLHNAFTQQQRKVFLEELCSRYCAMCGYEFPPATTDCPCVKDFQEEWTKG